MKRQKLVVQALFLAIAVAALLATGAPPAAAANSYLFGIDVSDWQGKPRWAAVKAAGVKFVIAKATNANVGRDPEYVRNRNLCRKRGIAFSAYHHAKPDLRVGDAIAEADNFLAFAGLKDNNLLPVLELKSHGNLSVDDLTEWVKVWLTHVEERMGVKPMIYATALFWSDHLGDTSWFAEHGYRLWVRHWGVDSPSVPANNWGGHGWTLWQNGKAAVSGIAGKVDTNFYNGTLLAPIRIKNNR